MTSIRKNMMSSLKNYPDRESITRMFKDEGRGEIMKVNNHIHSPYSFSAFSSIGEAVSMAASEEIRMLGINDFYVMDGYGEFIDACKDHRIFPLLNVELIGISKPFQEAGIRVNDPNNPGRTYISGKGLAYPTTLGEGGQEKLNKVIDESNRQVREMIRLLNRWMESTGVDLLLSVEEIMEKEARRLLRERHVARMVRIKLAEMYKEDSDFFGAMKRLYGGKESGKERSDVAGMEDELRSRLLKAGAPAFVPEDEKAFLPVEEILSIIREAGGIPAYPLLLDGAGGSVTEFEQGKEALLESLRNWGITAIEFIPLRNRFEQLKEYAEYFHGKGFVVSFGTEHNTTAMNPLTVTCKDGVPLDHRLRMISYHGAASQAAHQYLVAREGPGYTPPEPDQMIVLGEAVLRYYFSQLKQN